MDRKKKILHGNAARIDPNKNIVPRFVTNNLVAKKEQTGNKVPQPSVENTITAKVEVDENHK